MKKRLILLLALTFQFSIGQNTSYDVVFKNATVVTMKNNEVLEKQNIAIKNGIIEVIEPAKKSKLKGLKEYNLKGQYIMPSLSDAHVHLPKEEHNLERFFQLNLINGVTKVRSMRGEWEHVKWREKYNTAESVNPKMYLSAPPFYRNYNLTEEAADEFVKAAKDRNFDFIKILSIRNQEVFSILNAACEKYGLSIGGHYPKLASGNELNQEVLFKSNYTSFEHLGGLAGNTENLEERIGLIKEKNITICPTMSWYNTGSGRYSYEELRKLRGMEYVDYQTMEEWIVSTTKYRKEKGDEAHQKDVAEELGFLNEKYKVIKMLHKAGVSMILSPDASSKYMIAGFGVLGEMKLLKNADLSNFEILKMATANFSDFYNENYGTLENGKDADFIILKNNPLEDLNALEKINGLYYNSNYMSSKDLEEMSLNLLAE